MPNLTPDAPGTTPADPPSLVPGGGGPVTPSDPPSLVMDLPAPSPEAPPEVVPPSLPPLPANPENYIRKMEQVNASGATRTFLIGDEGNYVRRTHTGAMTDTVPTNATAAFPLMTVITIRNSSADQSYTGTGDVGVTLNGALSIPPGGSAQIIKVGINTWDVI